jgi:hypothetical protein
MFAGTIPKMIRYLLGVDDADSTKSQSTGDLICRLAESMQAEPLVEPLGVTRHVLVLNKHIRYTAHNSAICMVLDAGDMESVWEMARDFLSLESDRRCNAGLCMARLDAIPRDVMAWGRRAQVEQLTLEEAQEVAAKARIRTATIKGTGAGLIGALAAIGLHREGNDGRFLWLAGLHDLTGHISVGDILEHSKLERICTLEGVEVPAGEVIAISEVPRALLKDGLATLFVEQRKHRWCTVDKERLKRFIAS